jgi:hypothetical protein
MLETLMRESKMQVVRIEKPGVGDSAGPDCSSADLDDDLAAYGAGIRAALADAGANPARLYLFGGSIGAGLVPILAQEFAVRGVIAAGGFARTWYEHMLDIERRRLTLSGAKASEVNAAMKGFAQFYDLTLRNGLTPAQAIQRSPALGSLWYDAPAHQYGRPMRYYQQVQALDVESAWDPRHRAHAHRLGRLRLDHGTRRRRAGRGAPEGARPGTRHLCGATGHGPPFRHLPRSAQGVRGRKWGL